MATSTTRLALRKPDSDPVTGDNVDVDLDLNANWDKVDNAIGAFPCTSGTRPSSPYHGQFIRETDTNRVYVYNSTSTRWDQLLITNSLVSQAPLGTGASNAHLRMNLASGSILTSYALAVKGNSDTQYRFAMAYDGYMEWGGGSGSADVTLSRTDTDELGTDGSFKVSGKIIADGATVERPDGNRAYWCTGYAWVESSANYTFTTTPTQITGMTADLTTHKANAFAVVSASLDLDCTTFSAGVNVIGELFVDGVAEDTQIVFEPAAVNERSANAKTWIIPLATATTYTFEIKGSKTGAGGTYLARSPHSTMSVMIFQ